MLFGSAPLASAGRPVEPAARFRGETGEQATMFFLDPSGNAPEILERFNHPQIRML